MYFAFLIVLNFIKIKITFVHPIMSVIYIYIRKSFKIIINLNKYIFHSKSTSLTKTIKLGQLCD